MGSSEPQESGTNPAQGTSDHPHQGPEGAQPRIVKERSKQQRWFHDREREKRRWQKKRRAQATRAQPPSDSRVQKPGQVKGNSDLSSGLPQATFGPSQELLRPKRTCLSFGQSAQINQPYREAVLGRPMPQYPGIIHHWQRQTPSPVVERPFNRNGSDPDFTQSMKMSQPLQNPEHSRPMPWYPANLWQ